ncbi:MAG TPA: class I SAM-dependent methyltransferase [Mucilaginibacter sp.]|nr:class I SAM-dependent methyltransferase [Mucilaginibacter sp.]
MAANYNNSAWFYDRLSRLVYGKALIRSQVYLLPFISPGSKLLIAGGGTGWILEEIAKVHPSGLEITYIEVAANMMKLSKKRNTGRNKVEFINDAVENIGLDQGYDVVITPFLFDNFTEENLQRIFAHIHQCLKPGGLWLNTDFHLTGKWWQRFLLRSMIIFFRLTCRIEATKLPDIANCFRKADYKTIARKCFVGDFILSTVYRKI